MSTRLPIQINPLKLVEQRRSLQGTLSIKTMKRLKDALLLSELEIEQLTHHYEEKVTLELDFQPLDNIGLPSVKGNIKAVLPMQCQRCLKPTTVMLDINIELILTKSEAEIPQHEAFGYDSYLLEQTSIFLQDFVEDELLLSLPLIAKHPDEKSHCFIKDSFQSRFDHEPVDNKQDKENHNNPFAALANFQIKMK